LAQRSDASPSDPFQKDYPLQRVEDVKMPAQYGGKRDDEVLKQWVRACEDYFDRPALLATYTPLEEHKVLLDKDLSGRALNSYNSSLDAHRQSCELYHHLRTWMSMKKWFTAHFDKLHTDLQSFWNDYHAAYNLADRLLKKEHLLTDFIGWLSNGLHAEWLKV
ncbi:hypothetical protein KEM52_000030, partial [Ascosphaera acerosa]